MPELDSALSRAKEIFLGELRAGMGEIEEFLQSDRLPGESDFKSLRLLIHRLKGGAGFFGFHEFEESASRFEEGLVQCWGGGRELSTVVPLFVELVTSAESIFSPADSESDSP